MAKLFTNIQSFICRIPQAARRKIIQVAAFGFTNIHLGNFAKGTIYTGKWKEFCAPGLNCYSCPAAGCACPIGAMQAVSNSREFTFGFYALGTILAFGVVFGRAVCGYLCPFGLIQELLHLIPVPKRKLQKKWKYLRYLKYVILGLFVLLLPMVVMDATGLGKPFFCEYICPAGTLEAGIALLISNPFLSDSIGVVFWVKSIILLAVLVFSTSIYRFFCKVLCPLGAIYGLLNKISIYHLEVSADKCTNCGKCAAACKMDIDPSKEIRSMECILCGRCTHACGFGALKMSWNLKSESGSSSCLSGRCPESKITK